MAIKLAIEFNDKLFCNQEFLSYSNLFYNLGLSNGIDLSPHKSPAKFRFRISREKKERKERKIADRSMTKTKQIAQITEEMKSL